MPVNTQTLKPVPPLRGIEQNRPEQPPACVFRGSPPVIPLQRIQRFRGKQPVGRSEATLEWLGFPKWMASVK